MKASIRFLTCLFLGLLLALFFLPSNNLFAQDTALNMRLKQRNAADNSDVDRFIAPPAPDSSCLFFFNGSTVRPACAALGNGLNLSGGTLTAAATPIPFNYGLPVARTIAGSTSYQALDPAKPAVVTISAACTNTSTLLASSACTVQVRQAQSAVTCSTGTITMTWTSTVQLGVALTQNSGASMDVKLPIGGAFIACPVAGTFTIAAVEQTAG